MSNQLTAIKKGALCENSYYFLDNHTKLPLLFKVKVKEETECII